MSSLNMRNISVWKGARGGGGRSISYTVFFMYCTYIQWKAYAASRPLWQVGIALRSIRIILPPSPPPLIQVNQIYSHTLQCKSPLTEYPPKWATDELTKIPLFNLQLGHFQMCNDDIYMLLSSTVTCFMLVTLNIFFTCINTYVYSLCATYCTYSTLHK